MKRYSLEFKKEIVRLHLQEGRTLKSINQEYKVSVPTICNWCNELREECQEKPEDLNEYDLMKANQELRKELEELQKENAFLKKAAAFFAKEID